MVERSNFVKLHCFGVMLAMILSAENTGAWTTHARHASWAHPIISTTNPLTKSTSSSSPTTQLFMTAPDQIRRKSQKRQPKQPKKRQPNSILDDGYGHVNPELAQTLWDWEQQHRKSANMTKLSFSTRQGLRLVDSIVKTVAESNRGQKFLRANDDTITDLVQEGVMALMDVLSDYRELQEKQKFGTTDGSNTTAAATAASSSSSSSTNSSVEGKVTTPNKRSIMEDSNIQFEAYARPYIEKRLWNILEETTRPMKLPEKMTNLWKKVQKVRPQLREELGGRTPTTEELAARVKIPVETLEMLMRTQRQSLSMESTVEIKNPDSLEDGATHFQDQEEWEERQGHFLDTGNKVLRDENVEDYVDEQYQYEGDDEMWIHQEQIAGPLRELIPDEGPSPDDNALSEMIQHDVGEFLTRTLSADEVKVVRMAFGMDGIGKPLSMGDVSKAMGMEINDVKKMLKDALLKLRTSYKNTYVETYLDDEKDFSGEDSV